MAQRPPYPLDVEHDADLEVTVAMDPPEAVTGWAVAFTVTAQGGGTSLVTKTIANGGVTVADEDTGVFTFMISPDLDGLGASTQYVCRFRRTDAGSRDTLARIHLGVTTPVG